MSNIDVKQIWEQVKENSKKLESCSPPHFFKKKEEKLFSDYVCSKCGGEISYNDHFWYIKGLEHGTALKSEIR